MPIATSDSSTLYENIPHNKLKYVMKELINFCFKGGEKQLNPVTKFRATHTDNKNNHKITFDKASLKLAINFLLDNCFLILVVYPFDKSLLFPWVPTQHLLWQIYLCII